MASSTRARHDLSTQEKNFLRALGNIGVLSRSDAVRHFGQDTLSRLQQLKLVMPKTAIVDGKNITVLRMSSMGKKHTHRYIIHGSLYKVSSYQVKHDLKLSKHYLSITPEERKTWLNDAGVKKYLKDKQHKGELDGAYKNAKGQMVAVEVFTASYRSKVAAEKLHTAETCFDEKEILRA